VTASEFAFLALGLVLGVAVGAAIVEVLRSRPPAPRQVRVTVSHDGVPRRTSTFAAGRPDDEPSPARGGPAEHDAAPGPEGADPRPNETAPGLPDAAPPTGRPMLRPSIAISIRPEPRPRDFMAEALRAAETRAAAVLGDGARGRLRTGDAATGAGAGVHALVGSRRTDAQPDVRNAATSPGAPGGAASGAADRPAAAGTGPAAPTPVGPCADARRIADERCAVAAGARDRAGEAATALREARRRYEVHQERADAAAASGDPVRIRAAKDAAQRAFRAARDRAGTRPELEDAARTWLAEINRINAESRGATETATRERAAATELVPVLERLEVEADAARISAESAEEACVAARDALADCEEAAAQPAPSPAPEPAVGEPRTGEPAAADAAAARPPAVRGLPDVARDAGELAAAAAAGDALVFALLRGDRSALERVATTLAADDEAERRSWTLAVGALVEAIVDRAIEAAALDFPTEHFFWGPFTRAQNRDVAAALASLGFRFDGLGGWLDDRLPTQRDLSLAVGYAGLDPMRIRHWPNEDEMAELYRDVRVAADEYLAEAAGGLTLGELVSLLGRRADALAEVWNAWGRIRPILLESVS